MRLKEQASLVAVIVLLFLTCSCGKGGNGPKTEVSPSDKSLVELASVVYDDAQLHEIAEFEGTMRALDEKYPIECLREDAEMYRVSYLGRESVAVLMFDETYNKVFGAVYSAKKAKADFGSLTKGQSLDDVIAFDPDGDYIFLHTGRNEPRVSEHSTKDGYIVYIEYDESYNIMNISAELL